MVNRAKDMPALLDAVGQHKDADSCAEDPSLVMKAVELAIQGILDFLDEEYEHNRVRVEVKA